MEQGGNDFRVVAPCSLLSGENRQGCVDKGVPDKPGDTVSIFRGVEVQDHIQRCANLQQTRKP